MQSYEGHGADIKDFESVSRGQCTSRSLCWPMVKAPRIVTAVVTATARETVVSTIKTDHAAAMTVAENRAAVVSTPEPVVVVTKTVTMSLPSNNHQTNVYKPVEFYVDKDEEEDEDKDKDEDEDCDDEEQKTEVVTTQDTLIIHETTTHRGTVTHYSGFASTTTALSVEVELGIALALVTELDPITITPSALDEGQGPVPTETEDCKDAEEWEEDNEEHHHHKHHHHHHHKHHKGNKDDTYDEVVSCYWQDNFETTLCVTHVNEEFGSVVPWES